MADITMCLDNECKKRLDCYRFTAPKDSIMQYYFSETPRKDDDCDMYWEARKSAKDSTSKGNVSRNKQITPK